MLNVPLGPTPEKGPAGIQERLRGTVPWSRLGNPDPTEEAGLGAEGPMISQRCLPGLAWTFIRPPSFCFITRCRQPQEGSGFWKVAPGS